MQRSDHSQLAQIRPLNIRMSKHVINQTYLYNMADTKKKNVPESYETFTNNINSMKRKYEVKSKIQQKKCEKLLENVHNDLETDAKQTSDLYDKLKVIKGYQRQSMVELQTLIDESNEANRKTNEYHNKMMKYEKNLIEILSVYNKKSK